MAKDTQEINRIVYIEPNEFAELAQMAEDGVSRNNISWNPEDLQFTVDLQVEKCSRFDETGRDSNTKIKGSWASFMSGENLNTDTEGAAINSLTDAYTNISYTEYTSTGQSSRELLGIDSIDIDFSSHFYPQVKMRMTDVRGASLFQASEYNYQIDEWNKAKDKDSSLSQEEKDSQKEPHLGQSFFKSLFHFPYPRFLLTLKGFYGDKVTFVLSVSDFKSAFNSQTGNFDVEISFIGYMYGLYTDIPMNLVFTAPYYNRGYWDEKKKSGEFTYYNDNGESGNEMLTFPEFIEQYAHLLRNIDSSELGERENIVTLKKLHDEYNAFIQLQTSYKMTVGFVFEKNSIKEISSNQYRYNAYIFKNQDEISNSFTNSDSVIKTFTEKLDAAKEKYPEYTWLKEFNFPNSIADVPNYKIKNDGNFNPQLIAKLAKESELLERLQTYAINNDGQVCLFDKGNFESELDTIIKELGVQITKIKEETDNDVEGAITNALKFKFTVENVYRMIFAHIETFTNYFERYVNKINDKRESQERSAGYLNLDPRHSDLPTGNFNNFTYVPPFPSILDDNRTMIFPGASDNTILRSMAEVDCVETIVKAITQYTDDMAKAIEELNRNIAPSESESEDTFTLSFDPISVADIFYAAKGENPYQFLEEYMNANGTKAEYIVYFIYCRIMSAYGVERINLNIDDAFKKLCEREINNCITYFENKGIIFDNRLKQGIVDANTGVVKDIIKNNGNVENSRLSGIINKFKNKIYPFTNNKSEIKECYTYFTNPFNKTGNDTSYSGANISILNAPKKALEDFCVKLDETIISDANVQTGTYQFFDKPYKETNTSFCYTRVRNGESGKYNEKPEASIFLLSNNSTIKTKESKDVLEADRKKYVNLDITKSDENVETTFGGMQELYENSGIENLDNYFTGLLTYGEPKNDNKNRECRHLFLNKIKNSKLDGESLADLLIKGDDKSYDQFLAILYLSSIATYFNNIGNRGNADHSTSIFKFIEHNYKIGKVLSLPKPLILYYGGLTYFYDNFSSFSGPLKTLEGVIDEKIYKALFTDANKRYEFIDEYRNLFGYSFTNNFVGSANYEQLPYSVENVTLDTLYAFAKECFKEWYDGNEWKSIKDKLLKDKEYYIGEFDKNNKIPVWKHNGISDKAIKEFLCKTEDTLFLNDLNKDKLALDTKKMNILMSEIDRTFTSYQSLDERNAAAMKEGVSSADHNDIKTGLYYTLKNLYDRWFASQLWRYFVLQNPETDRKERNNRNTTQKDKIKTEFNSFLYVNSFYKDISNTYIMNPDIVVDCVKNYTANDKLNKNNSVYEFMAEIAEKNKLLLLALPVYNNFYDLETIKSIFTPNVLYADRNRYMQKELGIGNTYLVMYTGEPSSKLGDDQGDYQDDAVDLFGMTEFHGPETYVLFEKNNTTGTIDNNGETNGEFTVPAFGVTYAKQNQMYFKNISINMDNPQVTDYSLANLIQISYGGAHGDVNQRFGIGQNIYSIYSNRSYTCTVEMMGCMNIMPSMYFQLNNIPMFRGLYYIIKVSHSIKAGDITTKFMGVRINKNQLAECKFAFDFQTIYDKVLGKTNSGGSGIEGAKQNSFSDITVENLVYSNEAVARGINNEPTIEDAKHLELVAEFVNDLAKAWGRGLIVTSGYRSSALNKAVSGSTTSAHSYGYAVDLQAQRASQNVEFRKYVLYFLLTDEKWKNNYDQFIHENKNTSWTHVGLRNSSGDTGKEKLYYNSKINKNKYYKLEWDTDSEGMVTKFYYIKDGKKIPLDN